MASSDDEGESLPNTVSNYYFVDENNEPISLSNLPIQFDNISIEKNIPKIFLHGTADSGLQKIYKQVISWKFDVSDSRPEMFVLLKEKTKWVRILKPRKSFEDVIRSVLITVWCLCFVRRKPEVYGKAVWDHLWREFSSYEIRPSENDLVGHIALISEAVKRDETLAKSKFLLTFLEEKPLGKKAFDEEIRNLPSASFIVDDDMIDDFEEDVSDDEEDLYDTVCSICDNGGDILCCDGRCMRSFHATEEAGSDSYCESLGWSEEQVEATQSFICKNCQHKQHQCFACGELGSSDKLSGAEVFPCVSATCGRFYHLPCVAKLLHRDNADVAEEFQKKVSAGGTFTCPIHKCVVCKQGEDKTNPDLQFAVCRRCPKSYHRKCLPRKIGFEDDEDEGILQRAWEGLIPNRILIYCLKHEIDDELKTPLRNHIKFPGDEPKKKQASQQLLRNEKVIPKKKSLTSEDEIRKRNLVKVQKGVHLPSSLKKVNMSKQSVRRTNGQGSSKKLEGKDTSKDQPSSPALGNRLFEYFSSKSFKGLPEKEHSEKVTEKSAAMDMTSSVRLDNDSKRRIMALVEEATSSVTMEHIIQKQKIPKTHVNSSKYTVDKTITLGKVEGSVEAIRAALQKLEEGGSIEDAKAVCEPGSLHQIIKWKNKMRVYLSPFLYGMRYTSFGRHFTKVDKLKEIVNVLHRYVQDNDMIVDFCCGANDFSWLMKTKLDEIGKKCLYKNYDILQAKNDFNFEKRDWTSVQTNELPEGSRLIMGLNPPFGVQASLANKFIDKALEFKPKLLILIVPKETERLDKKKKSTYDLIWEDNELLAGKSFYLPGSVDVNDNQLEDWNLSAPPLYLWSRPDWTSKHMAIAQQHGHLSTLRELSHLQEKEDQRISPVGDLPLDDHVLTDLAPTPVHDHLLAKEEHVLVPETLANICENIEGIPVDDDDKDIDMDCSDDRVEIGKDLKKSKFDNEEQVRESVKPLDKSKETERHVKEPGKAPRKNKKRRGKKSRHSSFNANDDQPSRLPGSRTENEVSREIDYHLGQNMARSGSLSRTGYGVTQTDEVEKSHRLTSDELYAGSTNRRSGPDPDFGGRSIEEEFVGYQRESLEIHGFRPPHITAQEQYARPPPTSRGGLYEPHDSLSLGHRSSILGSSQEPAYLSPYNRLSSTVDPRMNSSTMQRYAPRLDEMNHLRTNNPGYDQFGVARSGYDQFGVARPGYDQFGRTANPDHQQDYQVNSSGFAPGPRSFTPHNQSGFAPGPRSFTPHNQSGFAPGPRSFTPHNQSGFAPGPRSFTPHNQSGWLNE